MKRLSKQLIIGTLPVIFGGLIYLTYRTNTLLMFGWFEKIGLSDFVGFLRSNKQLQDFSIPTWIKFSLPDALWLFSFTYILLILWDFKVNRQSLFWLLFAPTIGLFSEIGQLVGIVSGTFDLIDLVLLFIATVLPFFSIINLKTLKIKIV